MIYAKIRKIREPHPGEANYTIYFSIIDDSRFFFKTVQRDDLSVHPTLMNADHIGDSLRTCVARWKAKNEEYLTTRQIVKHKKDFFLGKKFYEIEKPEESK